MAQRYSGLYASFIEWDDPTNTIISSGGLTALTSLVSAEVTKKYGQITRGRVVLLKQANWDGLAVEGRIVSLYQWNGILNSDFTFPYREMGAFLVQKVKEGVDRAGRETVELSGMGVEHLLTKYKVWEPIGAETVYSTTLSATAIGPTTTALYDGAPHGNKSCTVDDVAGFDVGDEIRIEMGSPSGTDGVHISRLTGIEEPGWHDNQVTFLDRIPYDAPVDNVVTVHTAVLKLADMSGMAVGMRVRITLDDASVHETLIIKVDGADSEIIIRDGLPSIATLGKAVVAYDYSEPATDDVTQIIDPATADGWDVEFDSGSYEGTANGTTHAPAGDSVWDLLIATAQQTGEFFRLAYLSGGYSPRKLLKWQRSHVNSGITLYNYIAQVDVNTKADDVNSGIIYELYRERESDIITRLYPVASDGRISFTYCTDDAIADAASAGFTVNISDDLYQPDYIDHNAGIAAHGVLESTVRFGNITLSKEGSVTELQSASNAMLLQSMTTLSQSQNRIYWRCKCQSHRAIFPGQYVTVYNEAHPLGDGTESATYSTLYVLEVRETYNETGVIMTDLLLSAEPYIQPNAVGSLGSHLRATSQAARRQQTVETRTATYKIETASGGVGVTDHGLLTGLTDDDHAQYLRADGGRNLIGDLGLAAGVTVDGMDPSAHVANASAHHAPVTAGNTAIGLSGQEVSVALATNSGLVVASGLALNTPTSISTTSTNSVTGSTHAHAVTYTSEGVTYASRLLGTDANKRLSVGKLAAGTATTALSNTTIQAYNAAATDVALTLQANTSQSANIFEATTYGGTKLIKITKDGNLESGNPGFTSGLTGWQIAANGNAEFNDIVARGEFHAAVFVADELHATGGTLAVLTATKVAAPVGGSDNVLPGSVGSTFTLNVQAQHTDPGGSYFAANDVIRLKWIRTNLGGTVMDGRDVYLQVTSVGTRAGRDLANNEPGYYPTTCRWLYGGETTYQIPTGTAVVKWGQVSGSGYTGGIILTSDLTYSPYIDIYTIDATQTYSTWQSAPVTPVPRVRIGNLDGVLGLTEQWGIALGTNLSSGGSSSRYIVASDQQLLLQNVDLELYNGASKTVDIGYTGNVKFGTNTAAGSTTTFEFTASTGTLRVGPSVGPSFYWDGSDLSVRDSSNTAVMQLNSTGASFFSGIMTIGTGGGIQQGSGTAGTSTSWSDPWGSYTGLRIGRDGTVGRMSTYNAGVEQVSFDTTGKLTAGAGKITLDSTGMKFLTSSSYTWDSVYSIRFKDGSGNTQSQIIGLPDSLYLGNSSGAKVYLAGDLVEIDDGSGVGLSVTGGSTEVYGPFKAVDGISVGSYFTPNQGQFVSDLDGSDHNAIVLVDTTDVAHGMTSLVNTSQYGSIGKVLGDDGGVEVAGYSDDNIGAMLRGYVVNEVTTTATSSRGVVMTEGGKKSGTTYAAMGSTGNLVAVRNSGSTVFIIKGNGNFHYDGTGAAYDDYNDVALLRTADLALAGRLDATWENWLQYNRADLEAAQIVTFNDDGHHFVNGARFNRLLAGSIWQMHERLSRMEEKLNDH